MPDISPRILFSFFLRLLGIESLWDLPCCPTVLIPKCVPFEINENGIRKINWIHGKSFSVLMKKMNDQCFQCSKRKDRFEFEDGFFGYSEAKKIIQEEFWFLYDQSSDQNTFFREYYSNIS
ncbi:unnamed protein product [Blepharisma stoltei]|uniref:Uncharacterized protein n=1 Tax=Blepharisma stoltei TaxID=1481888 RepID=A0AAU9IR22_9CILI|nr:unnamed protein product [Blepharisma stoltei]